MIFMINGMEASFGSQGQHRSLVLSIKLAEIELMESITKESPILLLDDVMSDLTILVNLNYWKLFLITFKRLLQLLV